MILADRFVYIHYPKTGGTFVSAMLHKLHAGKGYKTRLARMLGVTFGKTGGGIIDTDRYPAYPKKHAGCRQIPRSFRGKPIISTIRNPYDLYVSAYEYGYWKTNPEQHFFWKSYPGKDFWHSVADIKKIYPNFPDLTFAEYVKLVNLAEFNQIEAPLLKQPLGWQSYRGSIWLFFKKPGEKILKIMDEDYISSLKFKKDMFLIEFIKKENLNRELYDFLVRVGYAPERVRFILEAQKVYPELPSGGVKRLENKWEKYYTPELKRFVRTRERLLFSLFPEYDF